MSPGIEPCPQWKAIVAMAANRVIGRDNRIPWHLPEDLRWFRKATFGHVVVMGRKTFDSLGRRPLPGRVNLVVSRSMPETPGVEVVSHLDALFEHPQVRAATAVWVIGGAAIYEACLGRCQELYVTVLDREVEGDTRFPEFEMDFPLQEEVGRGNGYRILRYARSKEGATRSPASPGRPGCR